MPVAVVRARRDHGDRRPDRLEEGLGRCGPAAVVGHLEDVDPRQPTRHERRVDVILDVAGQQEPAAPDPAEEHDRHVVDATALVGRLERHATAVGPEDAQVDRIQGQAVAGGKPPGRRPAFGKPVGPCRIAGSWTAHARLEQPADPVAIEQQRQAGDVILVRVGQDDDVEPPVPWR
jgi:hypothetical protein